jgi:hypothetical protein
MSAPLGPGHYLAPGGPGHDGAPLDPGHYCSPIGDAWRMSQRSARAQ